MRQNSFADFSVHFHRVQFETTRPPAHRPPATRNPREPFIKQNNINVPDLYIIIIFFLFFFFYSFLRLHMPYLCRATRIFPFNVGFFFCFFFFIFNCVLFFTRSLIISTFAGATANYRRGAE